MVDAVDKLMSELRSACAKEQIVRSHHVIYAQEAIATLRAELEQVKRERDEFRDIAARKSNQVAGLIKSKAAERLAEPAGEAKPAAWQWRQRPIYKTSGRKGEWSDWSEGRAPFLRVANYETEERPLYTTPPDASAIREAEKIDPVELVQQKIQKLSNGKDAAEYVIATMVTNLKTGKVTVDQLLEWFDGEGRAALAGAKP